MITALAIVIAAAAAISANAAERLTCNGMGDAKGDSVTLTLSGENAVEVDQSVAVLDRSYNPRLNLGFLRYEYQQSDEGTTEVLVQEQLIQGVGRGMIKVQERGEGFGTASYFCHP